MQETISPGAPSSLASVIFFVMETTVQAGIGYNLKSTCLWKTNKFFSKSGLIRQIFWWKNPSDGG
jgi:hypothetical protein